MATKTTKIPFIEGAAAATPDAGDVVAYAKADGLLYSKDDAGLETPLGGAGAVTTHEGLSDPHTGYQKESEKSAASGYASLDAGTKVPIAELPTGTTGSTVALGDAAAALDATHAAAGDPHTGYRLESADHSHATTGLQAGTVDHGALLGLTDDDHTQYQKESEKSAVNGYASLDAGTKVPIAELPTGTSGTTVALGDAAAALDATHAAAADPHTGYVKEADADWIDLTDAGVTTLHSHSGGPAGAPTTVDYLVGTADAGLSAEIVVGTSPGGELGGTWATPTVDATHSGSAHVDFIAKTFFAAKGDLIGASANDTPSILTVGTNGYALVADSAETTGLKWVPQRATLNFVIDGGGVAITTGIKGDIVIDFACVIESVTLLADQSGSIVVDIWKDTYANYPPVDADSITASAVPTITTATKSQDATLTGWTTAIAAGDTLRFNVDSITTCQRVTVSIKIRRT